MSRLHSIISMREMGRTAVPFQSERTPDEGRNASWCEAHNEQSLGGRSVNCLLCGGSQPAGSYILCRRRLAGGVLEGVYSLAGRDSRGTWYSSPGCFFKKV